MKSEHYVDQLRSIWLEPLEEQRILQDLFDWIADSYSPLEVYGEKGLKEWGFAEVVEE